MYCFLLEVIPSLLLLTGHYNWKYLFWNSVFTSY